MLLALDGLIKAACRLPRPGAFSGPAKGYEDQTRRGCSCARLLDERRKRAPRSLHTIHRARGMAEVIVKEIY